MDSFHKLYIAPQITSNLRKTHHIKSLPPIVEDTSYKPATEGKPENPHMSGNEIVSQEYEELLETGDDRNTNYLVQSVLSNSLKHSAYI